ncbi:toll/interleukin-1 receptor domain-containing protein [uncultured Microbacterium sp.]|uniref:toll/interleukin-1 receptor domain-containing protein n=1 Tax=uncultured Microbacterium sp. TaxID=191216 RepID=UPI0025DBEE10|nr:toll/interleukin-1 receptor domain-containing protein [uncultured Microbacterium sp.]
MTSEDFLASVFISYQHADKKLAAGLQDGLEKEGYFVWRDEGELRAGDSIVERVTAALDQIDFVVALISSNSVTSPWCQKELSLAMTGEIARNGVTVLPVRIDQVEMPASLKDKLYIEVHGDNIAQATDRIADSLQRHLAPVRPIPARRRGPSWQTRPESQPAPDAPIRVTGVDEKGMGSPRNDGTRGSALYLVPLRLSRRPSQGWATFFERTWNGNLFSTMHRPGIASVSGDRILLDGTTVEEVAQHHLSTVRQVVEEANQWEREARAADQREQQRRANAEAERQERIRATLDGMQFD